MYVQPIGKYTVTASHPPARLSQLAMYVVDVFGGVEYITKLCSFLNVSASVRGAPPSEMSAYQCIYNHNTQTRFAACASIRQTL